MVFLWRSPRVRTPQEHRAIRLPAAGKRETTGDYCTSLSEKACLSDSHSYINQSMVGHRHNSLNLRQSPVCWCSGSPALVGREREGAEACNDRGGAISKQDTHTGKEEPRGEGLKMVAIKPPNMFTYNHADDRERPLEWRSIACLVRSIAMCVVSMSPPSARSCIYTPQHTP